MADQSGVEATDQSGPEKSPRETAFSFALPDVRLLAGPIKAREERNHRYLLELDPDRLLHNFRVNAGLASAAQPLGGWEAPDHGLRGHFVGHYLSACGQRYAATLDDALRMRVEQMARELARCQQALGRGYLSAFPEGDLQIIETRFEGAWASYYVLHKILAGLLDGHRYCGDAQALQCAIALAGYIKRRMDKIETARREKMLRTDWPNPTNEFGGFSETLQNLHEITRNPKHLDLARMFDCEWFLGPLSRGDDQLTGLHCNTHIPLVLGAARRYELTGETQFRDAAKFFWERTAPARSYVNGGSSGPRPDGLEKSTGGEHWPVAGRLAGTLTPKINESCVTHNMLRLTEMLFRWTGDIRYADFFERAYLNSVLCMQHPHRTGKYIYGHPLGSGSRKEFGHANDTFWCCYGSSVEAFSRLAQGIYYHSATALWVNLFIASEVHWEQKGLRIRQQTEFPEEEITRLVFQCFAPVRATVNLRIPAWAEDANIAINGKPLNIIVPKGKFLPIQRVWHDGDVLELKLSMVLYTRSMLDDPQMLAFMYGPLVLAAKTSERLHIDARDIATVLQNVRGAENKCLKFYIHLANGFEAELAPLNEIGEEAYGVYFRLQAK